MNISSRKRERERETKRDKESLLRTRTNAFMVSTHRFKGAEKRKRRRLRKLTVMSVAGGMPERQVGERGPRFARESVGARGAGEWGGLEEEQQPQPQPGRDAGSKRRDEDSKIQMKVRVSIASLLH